jgi:hypothetical protein
LPKRRFWRWGKRWIKRGRGKPREVNLIKSKSSKNNGVFTGNKRLYNLKEASTYLGRSVWSVRELIWAGKIPLVRDRRRIFIDILDLEKFVEENKSTYI